MDDAVTPGSGPVVLDAQQLVRIEALHRGFLYQHLYAAYCLLRAGAVGALRVVVERDEDIEVLFPDRRLYIQVKTRKHALSEADVKGALARFAEIRAEHASGQRPGAARFFIASNAAPAAKLAGLIVSEAWPADVELHWPDGPKPKEAALPSPPRTLADAVAACNALAETLPFAMLPPETLTWKLAGQVMLASAGAKPREDHSFRAEELPALFEQLVVQMQDLPVPPQVYRAQINEPALLGTERVRIVSGLSGAGKTAWVAEAARHAEAPVTYLDVAETPGPALASAVAREVATRIFGRKREVLGEILLPGASALETLGALSIKLGDLGRHAHVVIDNAHRVPSGDLVAMITRAPNIRFLMLCQPGDETQALEVALAVRSEALNGWDEDTIAAAVSDAGCRADFADCERLSRLTGGLPFYVLNAGAVAAREYGGSIADLCADVESQTHLVEIAQEIILRRAFEGLDPAQRETVALLSLADVALSREEASDLLQRACAIDTRAAAKRLRNLPATGAMELFGNAGLKIHDAVRVLGLAEIDRRAPDRARAAKAALLSVIMVSIRRDWTVAKLGLLVRLLGQLGETRPLVDIATDELFHELGVWPEIEPFLIEIADDDNAEAETRLWALDGLAFNDLREGFVEAALARVARMKALLDSNELSVDAWLAWGTKRMLSLSAAKDLQGVLDMLEAVEERLPDSPEHRRVFRYNRAWALLKLGEYRLAETESRQLIDEYYGVIGLRPGDVVGRNAPDLQPLLPKREDLTETLKHLADSLELFAHTQQEMGRHAAMPRIHAMKFYELARAPQSLVRVGQDLVDEFVAVHDFIGARQILENSVFPIIQSMGLAAWVLPVRALYAVVLAYNGEHDAASAEMARIQPYRDGMDPRHAAALADQQRIIADLRRYGPPPQRQVVIPSSLQALFDERRRAGKPVEKRTKIGRNEKCPCGSDRKYKHCHGR